MTILNIDTADLSLENNVENSGYVFRGMTLVNADGSAEATVKDLRLVSDDRGDLIFSLHIPDPKMYKVILYLLLEIIPSE